MNEVRFNFCSLIQLEFSKKFHHFFFSIQRLLCPPVMNHFTIHKGSLALNPFEPPEDILIRGDSQGRLFVWKIKEGEDCTGDEMAKRDKIDEKMPNLSYSLEKAWSSISPSPSGIMDQLYQQQQQQQSVDHSQPKPKITASVYLPLQGNLICGREGT